MFFTMFKRPKIFKVRALEQPQKYGLAGRSLAELNQKACKKLQLPFSKCRMCLYEDGTELTEEYFRSIPDNTELVLLTPGQTWQGCIEPRFKNKSSYMKYNCESRIRGYMREVESYASTLGPKEQAEYKQIAEIMWNELKSMKFNGCYFDRREEETRRLCTSEGWFSCQGPFDADDCLAKHSINPYSNRESRILFSTWNLDHRIEKKRTIVPALAQAVKEQNGRQVNWEYFYQLLFTLENLKLVHIACHKKTSHNLCCDPAMIYTKRALKKAK
ncbi:DNA fragmentation factor subunit beta isoform X3 [Ambystoma mexicanum]|uniref:DNA fragmentation factor subunit beta isoform X3 n=1 Tax=Ambystoma mexicanum TaxID=8296 RepID=UPI0037E74AAF